jgi:hypothetical protein
MLVILTMSKSNWEVLVNLEFLLSAERKSYFIVGNDDGVNYDTLITLAKTEQESIELRVKETPSEIYRMAKGI